MLHGKAAARHPAKDVVGDEGWHLYRDGPLHERVQRRVRMRQLQRRRGGAHVGSARPHHFRHQKRRAARGRAAQRAAAQQSAGAHPAQAIMEARRRRQAPATQQRLSENSQRSCKRLGYQIAGVPGGVLGRGVGQLARRQPARPARLGPQPQHTAAGKPSETRRRAAR